MKTNLVGTIILVLSLSLVGCATTQGIRMKSVSEKDNIFREVKEDESAPQKGFADLIIKANLKTHLEDYYVLESKDSPHGKQDYPFLFNIDGQAVTWKVKGAVDNKPAYDKDGKASRDPEAREGMKYALEKKIRLAVGKHTVFFALPEENYSANVTVIVQEGQNHILEFNPQYNYKTHPTRIPAFARGVDRYSASMDGEPLPTFLEGINTYDAVMDGNKVR
jgi:hypothetical protein